MKTITKREANAIVLAIQKYMQLVAEAHDINNFKYKAKYPDGTSIDVTLPDDLLKLAHLINIQYKESE